MAWTNGIVDDDERWARADSILAKNPTPSAEQQMRRMRRSLWLVVVALTLLGLSLGLLVGLLGHHRPNPHDVPTWQGVLGIVIEAGAFLLVLAGLVAQRRANGGRVRWNLPTAVLRRAQIRELLAQIRGRAPLDPRRLGLARDLASRLVNQRGTIVLVVGIVLLNVGQTVAFPTWWRITLTGGFLVLFGVGVGFQVRDARLAKEFLDRHPEVAAARQPGD
jgi:hypothetical protein